jgi:8-oxo-dGTP pyrophosphatase MutT (NUDIX family)
VRWIVHGERSIYESDWVSLRMVDVEIPGERRFDHHVVHLPRPASGTVVVDDDRGVLLIWRHRFITDSWGWEIPAGGLEPGETFEAAAVRETIEETGWRPGPLTQLFHFHPTIGLSDQIFMIFRADGAEHLGPPTDPAESERIEWLPLDRVRAEIQAGTVVDSLSLSGLLWLFAGF